ncbi:hypothetical protein D3C78_1451000 [compost metagenome]
MDLLQRFQTNLPVFGFQIQRLAATHAGNAAGGCQFGYHRQPVAQCHVGHLGIGQNGKCQRLQGIAGQNGVGLTKFDVAGRLTATQIVVVHRRQIVMDQRIGVNAFYRSGGRIQIIQ